MENLNSTTKETNVKFSLFSAQFSMPGRIADVLAMPFKPALATTPHDGMIKTAGILVIIAASCFAQSPEALRGSAGKDVRWNSGWFDFVQPANFFKGDQLRLSVGGAATKVVVRFLDDPHRADSSEGVVGVYAVGSDRSVRITLDSDYKGILQVSVHGGPNPWNLYELGGGNGAATLSAVQVIRVNKK
jgi:hypothetical protein